MSDHETRTQYIALALIYGACIAIAGGCAAGWRDLIGFGLTFGGAGVGILTGSRAAHGAGPTQ